MESPLQAKTRCPPFLADSRLLPQPIPQPCQGLSFAQKGAKPTTYSALEVQKGPLRVGERRKEERRWQLKQPGEESSVLQFVSCSDNNRFVQACAGPRESLRVPRLPRASQGSPPPHRLPPSRSVSSSGTLNSPQLKSPFWKLQGPQHSTSPGPLPGPCLSLLRPSQVAAQRGQGRGGAHFWPRQAAWEAPWSVLYTPPPHPLLTTKSPSVVLPSHVHLPPTQPRVRRRETSHVLSSEDGTSSLTPASGAGLPHIPTGRKAFQKRHPAPAWRLLIPSPLLSSVPLLPTEAGGLTAAPAGLGRWLGLTKPRDGALNTYFRPPSLPPREEGAGQATLSRVALGGLPRPPGHNGSVCPGRQRGL